jgi:crotonobetainyl-CoA:carnitine CoA-transferase CaiB-like acyl-CoA transferase
MAQSNEGPLSGVTVLDLTSVLMGPYCTQTLGDMGADIIKVESPTGDTSRQGGIGKTAGLPGSFANLNRNKRSVVIDLKQESGRETLLRMIRTADVFVHSMRPHTLEKLGLSYDVLQQANPRLISCGMFGFGSKGRYREKAAYDDIIQAASGLAMLQQTVFDRPAYMPTVLADKVTGIQGIGAIAMALFRREKTGVGQHIEIPMFETMAAFVLVEHVQGHTFVPPLSPPVYARVVSKFRRPYHTITKPLGVLVYNDKQWKAFLTMIGKPELVGAGIFSTMKTRLKHIDEVYAFVEETLLTRSAEEWLPLLEKAEIPVMPVLSTEDLYCDGHLTDVGFFQTMQDEDEGELCFPGVTTQFSATPGSIRRRGPYHGEHSREILSQFGFSSEEIDTLVNEKAVMQRATTRA